MNNNVVVIGEKDDLNSIGIIGKLSDQLKKRRTNHFSDSFAKTNANK